MEERAARGGREAFGLDPERTTVHEAMGRIAGAGEVFRRFGLDTCCGGAMPVADAAAAHDVELSELLRALEEADAGG